MSVQIKSKKSEVPEFIAKLYSMMDNKELSNVIGWSETGTQIRIRNQRYMEYFILPTYFRHKNLTSFIRQLNNYSFCNVSNLHTKKGQLRFRNQHFQRDRKQQLAKIQRKSKKVLIKKSDEENKQPDIQPKHSPQIIRDVIEIGKECLEIVKNRPSILPELSGIFNIVNRVVFSSQTSRPDYEPESLKSFMGSQNRRATFNILQTLKDSIPVSLKKYDSYCSFDACLSKKDLEIPE